MKTKGFMKQQQGMILIISIIMLMVLSMLAIAAIRMSTTQLRAVNSTQARLEALSAAQRALDQILNSNFTTDIGSIGKTYAVAVDSGHSYDVVVSQPCMKQKQTILNSELNLSNSEDVKCYAGGTIYSDCARTLWELKARINEGFFGVQVEMVQGASIRMDNASALAYSQTAAYVCS